MILARWTDKLFGSSRYTNGTPEGGPGESTTALVLILYRRPDPCQTCHFRTPSPSVFSLVCANPFGIESSCAALRV